MTIITGKRILAVITGASRGIGKQIAISMASDCAPESAFVLLARNAQLLEQVKTEITELNPKAKVAVIIADFSSDKPIEKLEETIKNLTNGEQIEAKFIFHNAGTIGDVAKSSSNLTDTKDWHEYLHINLISMIALNCQLYKVLSEINDLKTIVVNTTSLAAIQPISSFTQYCVGKAAREAYFRNFALETDSRVLNYSPGPVETDMITEIGKSSFDPQIREMFSPTSTQSVDTHRKRLSPKETVSKLIAIIDKNEFDNGGREKSKRIQAFAHEYKYYYASDCNFNNSEAINFHLNVAAETIQMQYNLLKKELQNQGNLRIPCIIEHAQTLIPYYNTPYRVAMKTIYISVPMAIIAFLLTIIMAKDFSAWETDALIFPIKFFLVSSFSLLYFFLSVYLICFYISVYLSIDELFKFPLQALENLNNLDFDKILLKC